MKTIKTTDLAEHKKELEANQQVKDILDKIIIDNINMQLQLDTIMKSIL